MKHYLVTYEGRLWLSYAHNPKEAINQVILTGVDGDFHDFKARSVGSLVNEFGVTHEIRLIEYNHKDANEKYHKF